MRRLAVLSAFVIGLFPLFAGAYEPFDSQTVLAGAPANYVNDFANVLSADTETQLNAELKMFEASTSNQIAVAVVPDLGGDYIENYAQALFKDWGIGSKQHDNGVLLLLAIEDRKNRIEVGYGLEGALPDSIADSILRDMTADLRAGNYDAAIAGAVRSIEAATRNEYVGTGSTDESNNSGFPFEFLFVAAIFGFQFLAAILGRSKEWWLGGVLGAAAGGGISYFFLPSLLLGGGLTLALMLIGLAIDYVVSKGYHSYHDSGRTPPWFFGGPSSGSGFGGGGGFGGFGGGRSGGGGSSGSW